MYKLGNQVFIRYRVIYNKLVEGFSQWLVYNKYCRNIVLFPPNSLCSEGEIFLPYEYVELMEFILDQMARSDAFVFFNTHDYLDSYFTQVELLQWRRFKDNPVVYPAGNDTHGRFYLGQGIQLESLSKNQKQLWAGISVGIARSYKHRFNPGFAGGKYAKNCFLLPCALCGEHFLISQKTLYSSMELGKNVNCPQCKNNRFRLSERTKRGNYYRKPVIIEHLIPKSERKSLRVLESQEILELLVNNKRPASILFFGDDEGNLKSDIAKIGLFYEALAAIVSGIMLVGSLLDQDANK